MARIPFDIKFKPQIESGEYKVETGDGKPVRIISWDKNGFECKEIVALVACATGTENCNIYTTDGRLRSNPYQENMKLFIVTPEEELTEFEQQVENLLNLAIPEGHARTTIKNTKRVAAELLALAKKEASKDLPRWKKSNLIDKVHLSFKRIEGKTVICYHNRMIALEDLKKLPGFKEE